MPKPEISIIIPVYNVEKYLPRCLDSVLNQTFADWVAICIDDGSSDNSGKILDEYSKKDSRFIVVHIKNQGVSNARNLGLKSVKTPYVMFLDSDDCFHPQTTEIAYNFAQQKHVDIVSFNYLSGDVSINVPNWFDKKYDIKRIKNKTTRNLLLWATNRDKGLNSWYVQQCVIWRFLYKSDLIKSLDFPQDIKILEDFVFYSRVLFRRPRACIIKIPLYSYTENPNSALHTTDYEKSVKNLIAATESSCKYLYMSNLSSRDKRLWKSRFLWDVLSRVYSYTRRIDNADVLKEIGCSLKNLQDQGVFDNPPDFHAVRYKRRILKLISQIS